MAGAWRPDGRRRVSSPLWPLSGGPAFSLRDEHGPHSWHAGDGDAALPSARFAPRAIAASGPSRHEELASARSNGGVGRREVAASVVPGAVARAIEGFVRGEIATRAAADPAARLLGSLGRHGPAAALEVGSARGAPTRDTVMAAALRPQGVASGRAGSKRRGVEVGRSALRSGGPPVAGRAP